MKFIGYACRHAEPPLRDVFLPLEQLTVLLGRNDAGKSSLLRAVRRDLSGGHYADVAAEDAKRTGGVFFAVASDQELAALIQEAENLRRHRRGRTEPTLGARPPWGLRGWDPQRFDPVELDSDPVANWLTHLRDSAPDTPDFNRVLDALDTSRLVALEPAGLDEHGARVFNVSWCLAALDMLDQPVQEALSQSALLPFAAVRERSERWYSRGFYTMFHGRPSHLWAEGAPVVVAPIGQSRSIHLPRGLMVPTSFETLRTEVARSLNDLVEAATCGMLDAQRDEPLDSDEEIERRIPRLWLQQDEAGTRVHPDALGAAALIAAAANRLLPRFAAERYRVVVALRPLEEWVVPGGEPLDLRLRRDHPDGVVDEFPVEEVADGLRLWVQLALLEACEQAARMATALRDLAGDWWAHAQPAADAYSAGDDESGDDLDRQASWYAEQFAAVLKDLRGLDPAGRPWVTGEAARRLEQPPPENWTWRLGRHRRFFLVDEPERHLHPNLQREAAVWLRDVIRARDTPCLVATHSTPFLALPTDQQMPLYVYVARERRSTTCEPFDAGDLKPLDRIAAALGFDRGELLTTVSLFLLVEGSHDVVTLERIFEELRAARIAVVSVDGLSNYRAVLDSDILWRYTTAQVALAADNVDLDALRAIVGDPRAAKKLRQSAAAEGEEKILAKLIGAAERHGKTIHVLGHRGADLIDVLDENVVQSVFCKYPGHAEAQRRWAEQEAAGAKAKDKKPFYDRELGVPMDVQSYIALADAHALAGVKPPQLQAIVDAAVALVHGGQPSGAVTVGSPAAASTVSSQ